MCCNVHDSDYFRMWFLNYFNKLLKYQIHIQKNYYYSNCNSHFDFNFLDNHYLYEKYNNHFNVRHKKMLEFITNWTKIQISAVYLNLFFQSIIYYFICENWLSWLIKNVHVIINFNKLWNIIKSWHFFQSYDAELFRQLQTAYYMTENISSFSAKIS